MRAGDLFSNKSFFAVAKKQLQRGIKGVQNVYTQHQPYIAQTLEALVKNKLPALVSNKVLEAHYPYVSSYTQLPTPNRSRLPQEVIVFIFGGATYEEARYVAQFNEQQKQLAAGHAAGSSGGLSTLPTIYAAAVGAASTASGGGGGGAFDPRRHALHPVPRTRYIEGEGGGGGGGGGVAFDPRWKY
ncbi:Sec1 family-domain-containing protein [Pavlovales sp. CCMP2436]|nr:Sec1 family-domain-containing protein [Pavlovales sp. CCMP2436]